jgi:hypothetical protein
LVLAADVENLGALLARVLSGAKKPPTRAADAYPWRAGQGRGGGGRGPVLGTDARSHAGALACSHANGLAPADEGGGHAGNGEGAEHGEHLGGSRSSRRAGSRSGGEGALSTVRSCGVGDGKQRPAGLAVDAVRRFSHTSVSQPA